jgi:hypothetical protein
MQIIKLLRKKKKRASRLWTWWWLFGFHSKGTGKKNKWTTSTSNRLLKSKESNQQSEETTNRMGGKCVNLSSDRTLISIFYIRSFKKTQQCKNKYSDKKMKNSNSHFSRAGRQGQQRASES